MTSVNEAQTSFWCGASSTPLPMQHPSFLDNLCESPIMEYFTLLVPRITAHGRYFFLSLCMFPCCHDDDQGSLL